MTRQPPRDREYLERIEFARGHIPPGSQPVEPRPAATIITARRASSGFEVLLLKRPDSARFAAGVFVFAGGVVDDSDHADVLQAILPAGFDGGEGPALVAGLRELFEETGFLLTDEPVTPIDADQARGDLLSGRTTFADMVQRMRLSFGQLHVAYVGRWITPLNLSRRYDARFFLAEAPGDDPRLTGELTDHVWLSPKDALRRFESGTLPMLFPTRCTLEDLSRFTGLDEALGAYRDLRVEAILPRLLVRGDSVLPVLPGDPGFDEAEE